MKKKLILLVILCLVSVFCKSQDIHFSQMHTAPLYLNPANTGFFQGDYRMTAIYRNQWATVTIPYSTISSSIDFNFVSDDNLVGLGFVAFSDRAGDSKFTTNMFSVSLSYDKVLNRTRSAYLNAGMQLGYTNSYLDYTDLHFNENYLGAPLTETFVTNSYGYFDINWGATFYYIPDRYNSFEIGAAGFHLNRPVQTFMGDYLATIPIKYIVHAGASFPTGYPYVIYPKISYSLQYPHQELVYGATCRLRTEKSGDVTKSFYLGIMNRWNDAFILISRMDINKFTINLVYDINYSSLSKASFYQGGPEIAIQYIGDIAHKPHHKIFCPEF